jgi:hypothetical protein
MECKGRLKWRDAPLTKKAPYKPNGALQLFVVPHNVLSPTLAMPS